MIDNKKIKCWTKEKNNGKQYTTCLPAQQARTKANKPVAKKKKMVTTRPLIGLAKTAVVPPNQSQKRKSWFRFGKRLIKLRF